MTHQPIQLERTKQYDYPLSAPAPHQIVERLEALVWQSTSFGELQHAIVNQLVQSLDVVAGVFFELQPANTRLILQAAAGMLADIPAPLVISTKPTHQFGYTLLADDIVTLVAEQPSNTGFSHPHFAHLGYRFCTSVRVSGEHGAIGVLALFAPQMPPSQFQINLVLRSAASLLGVTRQWHITETQRQISEAHLQALTVNMTDMVSICDAQGTVRYVNSAVTRLLGYQPEEMVGGSSFDFVHPEDLQHVRAKFQERIAGIPSSEPTQMRFRHKDGSWRYLVATANNLLGNPLIRGVVINAHDVTDRMLREMLADDQRTVLELLIQDAPLQSVFEQVCHMIQRQRPQVEIAVECWHEGSVECVTTSERTTHIHRLLRGLIDVQTTPFEQAAMSRQPLFIADTRIETQWPSWVQLARSWDLCGALIAPVIGDAEAVIGMIVAYGLQPEDLSDADLPLLTVASQMAALAIEYHTLNSRLDYHAHHDIVTGLPNRRYGLLQLHQALNDAAQRRQQVAVCIISIDRLQNITESLGYLVGDVILREITNRFRSCLTDKDILTHMRNDEFTLISTNLASVQDAMRTVQRLLVTLLAPFYVDRRELRTTATSGISIYPQDGSDVTTLLRNADSAMRLAKRSNGTRQIVCYSADITASSLASLDIEHQLYGALQNNEFVLYYQPQFELPSRQITGFEALIRWNHPERGLLLPGAFMRSAQECGLMSKIGNWVLEEVCRQMTAWQVAGMPPLRASINISPLQLASDNWVSRVTNTLARYQLDPTLLTLEITEHVMLHRHRSVVRQLRELQALGVEVTIDDFGTGYSSLAYLQHFPLNGLKIDKSFVQSIDPLQEDISTDRLRELGQAPLVQTIVDLAHHLRLNVIAEGVETERQLRFLQLIGCDEIQGFLLARPMPAEDLQRLVSENHAMTALQSD